MTRLASQAVGLFLLSFAVFVAYRVGVLWYGLAFASALTFLGCGFLLEQTLNARAYDAQAARGAVFIFALSALATGVFVWLAVTL